MSQKIYRVLGLISFISLSGLTTAQQLNWSPAGPVYNAGRARNMIVDKSNPQVLFVGSASSGIFKSIDAGSSWNPINDQAKIRNISYLAQSSDGNIYAGTGEGFLRTGQKAKAQIGTGFYKLDQASNPAVLVMVASSSVVGTVINRVACSPTLPTHIALATNLGIFVSTNGTSFSSVTLPGAPTGTAVSGQDLKFDSNGILYCTIGTEAGTSTISTASKVYKASDANFTSFTNITPSSPVLSDNYYGRIELAIAPSNANVIYASCSNKYTSTNSATLKGLFVSYNAGATWGLILQGSPQLDPLSNGATRASGDYAHVITVDPSNSDVIYIAGYRFYIFERTGGSDSNPIGNWNSIGQSGVPTFQNYLHENIHDIKLTGTYFATGTKMYFITDAGVFRSVDKALSFQPFYKGLVTGQYNSVSIERYPVSSNNTSTVSGTQVNPFIGFIGGTGGNGMTYFSGRDTLVTKEYSYIGGEVYNTEYSEILSNAALSSVGTGGLYRSTDVRTSDPALVNVNEYSGILSKIAPNPVGFSNTGVTTGTPFKLWENYGKQTISPDSVLFYNDSLRLLASMSTVAELTSKSTFTFSASRPNKYSKVDSIVVRTGTVQLPLDGTYKDLQTPFTTQDRQTITIKLANNYTASNSVTALSSSNTTGPISGPATFTLNSATLLDDISITFTAPPFATKTITQYPANATGTSVVVNNPANYYRVFATVFYKYVPGSVLTIVDNNISTKTNSYTTTYLGPDTMRWAYGTLPTYTLSTPINTAIPSPTYYLQPGNIPSASPIFTVRPSIPAAITSYTVLTQGTNTLTAISVSYTLAAVNNTAITSPTYILNPGNVSQPTATFVVTPTVANVYTITQVGTGTLTQDTQFTVNASAYSLNNSTLTQSSPIFIVTPTINTTYTVQGISSNTVLGANTNTTYITKAGSNTFTVGSLTVPMCFKNIRIKMPMAISARLACILTSNGITGGVPAVVVAKNPLALNDPLNFVRVSQTGAYSDDVNGNPTTNTISIPGKPVLLEWSKSGTEIYFATSDNKLYRVSHITTIMDLSPSSYSGKFYTDVFKYAAPPNSTTLNDVCPYRTTLIGSFDKPIASISVTNDDKNLAVTFNGASTGTTGTVLYNTIDARKSNETNIAWVNKEGTGSAAQSLSNTVTYCSMMEKSDNKKVFVGTDNGMFYTSDITSNPPIWTNVNNNQLPSVQIFDIKQQLLDSWDCYNSGQIYVATYGRGVWTNGTFFKPFAVEVYEEKAKPSIGTNLSLYPNPTNGNVNVIFTSVEGETASISIMDISGRLVKTENIGKINSSDEVNYSFETNELKAGVYIVNINSNSGIKRVSKLVVTK